MKRTITSNIKKLSEPIKPDFDELTEIENELSVMQHDFQWVKERLLSSKMSNEDITWVNTTDLKMKNLLLRKNHLKNQFSKMQQTHDELQILNEKLLTMKQTNWTIFKYFLPKEYREEFMGDIIETKAEVLKTYKKTWLVHLILGGKCSLTFLYLFKLGLAGYFRTSKHKKVVSKD